MFSSSNFPQSAQIVSAAVERWKKARTKRTPADTTQTRIHDVFLSFRGEDTRASFTSHLYASLQNTGINVFKDDDSLQRGDNISTSLIRAIEGSQISVIIFSTNYADSRWCLDELAKIMECNRTIGQVVLPVFYDVDPSEVRHQTGEFGKVFQNLLSRITEDHELFVELKVSCYRRDEVKWTEAQWTEALRQAASLSGFVVLNFR
jgi:ABC-type phosphate transport system substrate-binding protein